MNPRKIIHSLSGTTRRLLATAALVIPLGSHATLFSFGPLCDESGCGTAEMDISILGNTLTMLLDNTSPTTLDDGTGINTPGITGFGFNVADPTPTISGWSMTAFNTDGSGPVTIDDQTGTGAWVMNTFVGGVSLDFLPTAGVHAQIKGALYNPSATTGLAAAPNYETGATLVIDFTSAPVLNEEGCGGGVGDCTTFVRMQNVGLNGDGSLKLPGNPPGAGGPPASVPEPRILALLSLGMLGGLFMRRRRFQEKI